MRLLSGYGSFVYKEIVCILSLQDLSRRNWYGRIGFVRVLCTDASTFLELIVHFFSVALWGCSNILGALPFLPWRLLRAYRLIRSAGTDCRIAGRSCHERGRVLRSVDMLTVWFVFSAYRGATCHRGKGCSVPKCTFSKTRSLYLFSCRRAPVDSRERFALLASGELSSNCELHVDECSPHEIVRNVSLHCNAVQKKVKMPLPITCE